MSGIAIFWLVFIAICALVWFFVQITAPEKAEVDEAPSNMGFYDHPIGTYRVRALGEGRWKVEVFDYGYESGYPPSFSELGRGPRWVVPQKFREKFYTTTSEEACEQWVRKTLADKAERDAVMAEAAERNRIRDALDAEFVKANPPRTIPPYKFGDKNGN